MEFRYSISGIFIKGKMLYKRYKSFFKKLKVKCYMKDINPSLRKSFKL